MSKRGLSREEKKTKMMELFHENSEFFTMKELEKNAPKQKGITQQTVKEIVDELVSDGMINMDKIGTGNYYWAFPSASGAMKTAAVTKATKELEGLNGKLAETHSAMKESGKGREDTAERRQLLAELESLNATSVELKAELEAFGAADPAKFEKKKKAVQVCKEAAGRWTDNTMILLQYACSMGAEVEMIRQVLGIGETWEDLPYSER